MLCRLSDQFKSVAGASSQLECPFKCRLSYNRALGELARRITEEFLSADLIRDMKCAIDEGEDLPFIDDSKISEARNLIRFVLGLPNSNHLSLYYYEQKKQLLVEDETGIEGVFDVSYRAYVSTPEDVNTIPDSKVQSALTGTLLAVNQFMMKNCYYHETEGEIPWNTIYN